MAGTWTAAARPGSFTVTRLFLAGEGEGSSDKDGQNTWNLKDGKWSRLAHRRWRINPRQSSVGVEEDEGCGDEFLHQKPIKLVGTLNGVTWSS